MHSRQRAPAAARRPRGLLGDRGVPSGARGGAGRPGRDGRHGASERSPLRPRALPAGATGPRGQAHGQEPHRGGPHVPGRRQRQRPRLEGTGGWVGLGYLLGGLFCQVFRIFCVVVVVVVVCVRGLFFLLLGFILCVWLLFFVFLFFNVLHFPFREIRAALPGSDYSRRKREQRYPVLQVHAGSFRVSVIHPQL